MPFDYENQGSPAGRQKGTYRGIVTGAHVHFVGRNDHLQVGGNRFNIRWAQNEDRHNPDKLADIDRMREGWEALKAAGDVSPGVADCKRWVRSYLIDYHKINASKVV